MHIKIEISSGSLREFAVRCIAKEIVVICKKENDHDYAVEDVMQWFNNASIKRLISCWIRLVWPGTKRHLSQYPQWPRRKKDKLTDEDARNLSFLPVVAKEDDGCVIIIPMGEGVVRIEDKEAAKRLSDSIIELFDVS